MGHIGGKCYGSFLFWNTLTYFEVHFVSLHDDGLDSLIFVKLNYWSESLGDKPTLFPFIFITLYRNKIKNWRKIQAPWDPLRYYWSFRTIAINAEFLLSSIFEGMKGLNA
jgi:hypothetical protein